MICSFLLFTMDDDVMNFSILQVFPIKHLEIFTEEELEKLLCGERDSWAVCIFHLSYLNWGIFYYPH